MISLALISAFATGVIAYINTTDNMKRAAEEKLVALLESRKSSLGQYFNRIEHKISFHAQSPLVIDALKNFTSAWALLPQDKTAYLQSHYIDRNPFKMLQFMFFYSFNTATIINVDHLLQHIHSSAKLLFITLTVILQSYG